MEDTKCGQLIQSVSHCDKESWTALKDLNITHLELPYLNITYDIADNMSCHTAYTDVRWQ